MNGKNESEEKPRIIAFGKERDRKAYHGARSGEFFSVVGALLGSSSRWFDKASVSLDGGVSGLISDAATFFRAIPCIIFYGIYWLLNVGKYEELKRDSSKWVGWGVIGSMAIGGVISQIAVLLYFQGFTIAGLIMTLPFVTTFNILLRTIFAQAFLKEKYTPKVWLGVAIAILGLVVVSYGEAGGNWGTIIGTASIIGPVIAFLSAICFSVSGVFRKWSMQYGRLPAAPSAVLRYGFGNIAIIIIMAGMGTIGALWSSLPLAIMLVMISGIIGVTVGAVINMVGTARTTHARSGIIVNTLNSVLGSLGGWAIFGEFLNEVMVLGIVIAAVGTSVVLMSRELAQSAKK